MRKIDNSTIIVKDFESTLSVTDRGEQQKNHKVIGDLNNTINHLSLIPHL